MSTANEDALNTIVKMMFHLNSGRILAVVFSAIILLKTKVYLSKLLYLGGENHGIYECYC